MIGYRISHCFNGPLKSGNSPALFRSDRPYAGNKKRRSMQAAICSAGNGREM